MYRGVQETADCTHLVAVQPPVLQLLLEERPADVSGVVELAGPVVVQDLAEHSRVSALAIFYYKYKSIFLFELVLSLLFIFSLILFTFCPRTTFRAIFTILSSKN